MVLESSHQWKKLFIFNLRWRGGVLITLPLICLLTAVIMIAGFRAQTLEARRQEQNSQQVLNTANRLLLALQKAEAAARGYSVTEDEAFKGNYQQAKQVIEQEHETLRELLRETEERQLATISNTAETQVQYLETTIAIGQDINVLEDDLSPLSEQLLENQVQLEELESAIAQFIQQQEAEQEQREQQVENWARRTNQVQWLALLIGLGATGGGIYLFASLERQLAEYTNRIEESNAYLARTTETLKKRNQELDQFAYIVSHDLKAPLRAISNLSTWLEEDLRDKLDPDTQYQMDLLRGRVHRMESLINGILEYSRVGRTSSQIETVNVEFLLQEIIDSLAPPPEFTIKIIPPMPTFKTERFLLQQVFSNLISNAIKHHNSSHGTINIRSTELETVYQFEVEDDGPGIDPKFHDKIFVMFQTLEARDKTENTGVGLAIIKKNN